MTMNIFHLSCRNFRPLVLLTAAIVLLYVIVNIVYITFVDNVSPADLVVSKSAVDEADSILARVKFGKPDANGKVEVVLSLGMKQLAELLNNGDFEKVLNDDAPAKPEPIKLTGGLPRNVSFVLHDPTLCDKLETNDLHWIVVVLSTPANAERRTLLRETWANPNLFRRKLFTTVFLLGLTENAGVQESVRKEFEQHRDILQGDFADTARNSTLKGLMALQYVSEFCSHASYVIKTNDDTFLNVFEMINVMNRSRSHRNAVICPLWQDNSMKILRDPKTCMEWCVADDELPGRTHFPQYCAGLAFILSRDLIRPLYEISRSTPYFWIDDVYITGLLIPRIVAKYGSVHYVDIIQNLTQVEGDMESQYAERYKPATYVVAKIYTPSVFRRVWKSLLNRLTPVQFKLLSDAVIGEI
jgi:beta-1,3-galactosyltransferase 1